MQPAALPAPDEPGPWDDQKQPNTPYRHPAPVPRRQIIGLPDGHLKDASGAAMRPGCARSLTCPARSPQTLAPTGEQETPVTHALPMPSQAENTRSEPALTRPRSFRDECLPYILDDVLPHISAGND